MAVEAGEECEEKETGGRDGAETRLTEGQNGHTRFCWKEGRGGNRSRYVAVPLTESLTHSGFPPSYISSSPFTSPLHTSLRSQHMVIAMTTKTVWLQSRPMPGDCTTRTFPSTHHVTYFRNRHQRETARTG